MTLGAQADGFSGIAFIGIVVVVVVVTDATLESVAMVTTVVIVILVVVAVVIVEPRRWWRSVSRDNTPKHAERQSGARRSIRRCSRCAASHLRLLRQLQSFAQALQLAPQLHSLGAGHAARLLQARGPSSRAVRRHHRAVRRRSIGHSSLAAAAAVRLAHAAAAMRGGNQWR